MRRANLFLAPLIAALVSLTVLTVAGMYVFTAGQQSPYNWMTGMFRNGRMGGPEQKSVQNSTLPVFGVAFVVLIGVLAVGVVGLAYYVALPEIETGTAPSFVNQRLFHKSRLNRNKKLSVHLLSRL